MEKHTGFQLDSRTGYFKNNGVDVMAFMDIYPVGHQAGVSMIMHGSSLTGHLMKKVIPSPRNYAIPIRISI